MSKRKKEAAAAPASLDVNLLLLFFHSFSHSRLVAKCKQVGRTRAGSRALTTIARPVICFRRRVNSREREKERG